jgi:hypothetical protein
MSPLRLLLLPSLLVAPLVAGCGGNVVADGSSTSTGAGGATSTTSSFSTSSSFGTSGTSGTTGTGFGSTSTGTGFGSTTSASSSSSSGTTGACVGSSIQVSPDNGGELDLGSNCASSYDPPGLTTPLGYLFAGGPAPGTEGLAILGCSSEASNAQGLRLFITGAAGAGNYGTGTAQYVDATGETWSSASGDMFGVLVIDFGAVGQAMDGKFAVTVQSQGPAIILHTLVGSFHVCRVMDQDVP